MSIAMKAPGRYVQGFGERKKLGQSVKKLGSTFYVLCSPGGRRRFGEEIEQSLTEQEKTVVFAEFHGEATKAEVFAHMDACKAAGCDAVIGMGGGKVIDTAKTVAENLGGLPCIIIPTVASNDAPCSGVAVLYNEQGVVAKAVMMRRNPDLVLVDTEILSKAPARLLSAGMGDALSTWFEAEACRKNGVKTMARGQETETVAMMSRLCYDLLLRYGSEALDGVKRGEYTPALEKVVEANILLSGVGFESGGLAAAHAINDGFAQEPQAHGMYHGEKVAFGVLTQLVLQKTDAQTLEEVLGFLARVELPMTLAQLGITEIREETLRKVAEAACVPTQSTKNLSPDITAEDVYQALLEADRIGREYLAR